MFADMMISCRSFHIFAFREGETTFSGDLKYLSQFIRHLLQNGKVTDIEMKRERADLRADLFWHLGVGEASIPPSLPTISRFSGAKTVGSNLALWPVQHPAMPSERTLSIFEVLKRK
jgi:hypothetical protein